jgi:hypothetical protein
MAILKPKYIFLGEAKPIDAESPGEVKKEEDYSAVLRLDKKFISDLQALSTEQIAQSIPFVSLKTVNTDGKPIENITLSFFQKAVDFDNISNATTRFSDRPIMSLKDLQLKTDLAGGYLYYTTVTLSLKIHSPYALLNGTLIALLIPGVPLILEYGRNGPVEVLNEHEILLFAVRTYNLTIDQAGQIDLTIEGMAFNEKFGNVMVGDEATKGVAVNDGTVYDSLEKLKRHLEYLTNIAKQNKPIDYNIPRDQAQSYMDIEERAKEKISEVFKKGLVNVEGHCKPRKIQRNKRDIELGPHIPFHDLFYLLCDVTLQNVSSLAIGASEFRVVYGMFNENAGPFKNRSIADFPICYKTFTDKFIGKKVETGERVISIQALLNYIAENFIDNKGYWEQTLGATGEDFVMPFPVYNFCNYRDNETNATVLVLQILDVNRNVPNTTGYYPSKEESLAPENYVEEKLKKSPYSNLPIIRLGHAGSFIKTTSLTQILDEYMKATLIKRMYDAGASLINQTTQEERNIAKASDPLVLPLQGTMEVLGHIKWRPFKCFYLDAGIYIVNGVYKIISVTHKLSHQGFSTSIEFMYN